MASPRPEPWVTDRMVAAAALISVGLEDRELLRRLLEISETSIDVLERVDSGVLAAVAQAAAVTGGVLQDHPNAVVTAALMGFTVGHEYVARFGPLPQDKEKSDAPRRPL